MRSVSYLAKQYMLTYVGKRVRLLYSSDPFTKLSKGDEGTVTDIDDLGTIHVKWDSGSSLGLVAEDNWEFVV
jgi:hypothetical protein